MKAAFLTGMRKMEVRQIPQPRLASGGDVLLKVATVGVCGSDMHYYKEGRIGEQIVEFPWVIGHEFAGTIAEVGPEVVDLKSGRRVAVDPCITCGTCDQCAIGRKHTCRNQRFIGCPGQAAGALVEYIAVPASCCYPIPDAMTFEQATVVEPFSIALWARKLSGATHGAKVAILGCGPIGLCVLLAMKAAGGVKAYVTDILENRLALARKFAADWTGNPRRRDVVAAVGSLEPEGLDFVFECAGEQETIDQGVELLKPGGTLLILGIFPDGRAGFEMNQMRRKELRVQNVRRQNDCVAEAIELAAAGKADLGSLVTHHFPLDETADAFDTVADYRDGVIKAVIHVADRA